MSGNYIRFPKEYPVFYVDVVNDWWEGDEYSSILTNRYTDFLAGGTEQDIAFVFSSKKLALIPFGGITLSYFLWRFL